jgi:anti-anti-sigma factor
MSDCRLRFVKRRGRTVAVLEGELDLASRELLEDTDGPPGGTDPAGFALDLGGISFIDVAGLEVVSELYEAWGAPPPIRLLAASPVVQRLISLLEIQHAFDIEQDL